MSNYGVSPGVYVNEDYNRKDPSQPKLSLRQRLGHWLLKTKKEKNYNGETPVAVSSIEGGSANFARDFNGWTIRIHKANNGHIIEAWKAEDHRTVNARREHEMFLLNSNDDVLAELPHILTNLMLKG